MKEGIESLDGETQTLLKDSEMLLGEAREALQNATSNLQVSIWDLADGNLIYASVK